MKKILSIIIIAITILTIGVYYYTNDVLTVAINSTYVAGLCLNNYFFQLDRSGNLYAGQVDRNVEVNLNDKKWIKEHSKKMKLPRDYTKKILNKTKEIYDLYYRYQPKGMFTNQWSIDILYKNKYFNCQVIEPLDHTTGPQIDELIKLLVDIAPFYIDESLTMGL